MTDLPRILIVDDNESIHGDFRRILDRDAREAAFASLDDLERALGGGVQQRASSLRYELRFAFQGEEGVRMVATDTRPFAVAFVDVRMPPGIDGVETIARMWQHQPELEVVLCSAHSDYSWDEITRRLDPGDRLVVLRKPFDSIEVRQLAACLTEKWSRGRALAARMRDLEAEVASQVEARVRERARFEEQQRISQRLEVLGQVAAGLAHEINTPTQFATSNLEYLATTLPMLENALHEHRVLLERVASGELSAAEACARSSHLDHAEALAEAPHAIADVRDGLARITRIVQSVRAQSHVRDHDSHVTVDLNEQVRRALELARNEYKHDADAVVSLGDVPHVVGNPGDLCGALLNLIVNAAHAIREQRNRDGKRGVLAVKTYRTGNRVEIVVADTGGGIPDHLRERVFEPFFTTKPVGQGTGQGLTIVRATIVERHRGTLCFESEPGKGTSFVIGLPIEKAEAT